MVKNERWKQPTFKKQKKTKNSFLPQKGDAHWPRCWVLGSHHCASSRRTFKSKWLRSSSILVQCCSALHFSFIPRFQVPFRPLCRTLTLRRSLFSLRAASDALALAGIQVIEHQHERQNKQIIILLFSHQLVCRAQMWILDAAASCFSSPWYSLLKYLIIPLLCMRKIKVVGFYSHLGFILFSPFFSYLHLIHIPSWYTPFPSVFPSRRSHLKLVCIEKRSVSTKERQPNTQPIPRQAHPLLSLSLLCFSQLTVLPVVGDLHLALLGPLHSLRHLADGLGVGQVAVEEVASAGLLHDVRPGEARHLAEAVVAVNDCTVLHPGVGDHKFPICVAIGNGRMG